jgi:dTDP-4-amino-4,6-dideoxygalactose transaminase
VSSIPLVDVRAELAALRADIDAAIARVLDSGVFIGGPEVEALERELAPVAGGAHAIGVSSGTDALLVALMALGVGPGDEVVTTPFSFFATVGCIARLGARPVFADIEAESFNMAPAAAASCVSPRTRLLLPVHLYGRPATLPTVAGLDIVEDAAQSIGASPLRGRMAALSFFPTKNLGAVGDGGAVITDDPQLAARIRKLRVHGAEPKYHHDLVGGNFRLDPIQAAILRVKLRHLADYTRRRRANAARYRQLFAQAGLPPEFRLPGEHPQHIYNQFVVRAPERDRLRTHLAAAGIATEIYYPVPLHLQRCFVDLGYRPGAFPEAERASQEVLALPVHPMLTPEQQDRVVDAVAAFYRG